MSDGELFTANRLALLTKLDRRAVEKKLLAVVPAEIQGKARFYRLADALPALCHENENAELERRILEHRERDAKTTADRNEIELLQKTKELVFAADMRACALDYGLRLRATIEGADDLKPSQKTKLLARIAAIKLEELETE